MKPQASQSCTAFAGHQMIASGPVAKVALALKEHLEKDEAFSFLVFDDETSAQVEFDLRGSKEDILSRLKPEETTAADSEEAKASGPGRPRLGVVAREVTLLPRHWEWLATQPGGASATLRKLVEDAKRATAGKDLARRAQDATYKFMSVVAGNLPGYEEVLRALYAKDKGAFTKQMGVWPADVRKHAERLAEPLWNHNERI